LLPNTDTAKLYLSIIDDVIESMRELFLDEGLEDCVLDDLRRLWESKMMQSKAMEDFRKNNINSSNFVLQLPASYTSVVIPASQNIPGFPVKTMTTFSLPAGLAYPVQIPAGVTLQTASGQLYKVNVPVVVTQAPAGQQPVSHSTQKAPAPQSAAIPTNTIHPQEVEPPPLLAPPVSQPPQPKTALLPSQENSLPQQPQVPAAADTSQLQGVPSHSPEVTLGENEPSPQSEPVNLSMSASPSGQALDFQLSTEEALTQTAQLKTRDIDDILKKVIEEEREKAEKVRKLVISLIARFNGLFSHNTLCVDKDPLNSGDDVIEQDIPDLFDTDNVIVCQYDKIHRSKNRWKFHLKDGVMCYAGRDYVFSKAVGEAEW
uniref:General transcription factor IIA, 1-like n=1 Tax=Seriola lalandi dorsalis TaxID=1841481 RepID=A0A3B4YXV4_SERLL